MKKLILVLAALAATIACKAQDGGADYGTKVETGQSVPQFTVTMVDGSSVRIADMKGKVVLINFWATWCPPCREELKRVQKEIVDRFKSEDFVFLPISRGEDKKKVEDFLAKNRYKWAAGLDTDESIFKLFAEKAIPRNFVIDRNGKIASIGIGYDEASFEGLIEKIDNILKTK